MPVIATTDIPDLIEATLEDLGPMKLTDLTSDTNEYIAYNRIMRESQVDKQSGSRCRINVLTTQNNTSRFKGYYAVDGNVSNTTGLDHGQVDWAMGDFVWGFDENEQDVNSGASQIQDYVRVKRHQAYLGNAQFIEDWFWGSPPVFNDKVTALPLRYWLTKNVSATGTGTDTSAGGGSFDGSYPIGSDGVAHTTIAGFTLTGAYLRFKNYTFKYVDVTEEDLITKWNIALTRTNFTPPAGLDYPSQADRGFKWEHFVSLGVKTDFEKLARRNNENLGYDFMFRAPMMGRAPLVWAQSIDSDTDQPIYSVNWNTLKNAILKGKYMVQRPAVRAPNQHTVWANWVDFRWQFICYDRRRNSVGAKAAANP